MDDPAAPVRRISGERPAGQEAAQPDHLDHRAAGDWSTICTGAEYRSALLEPDAALYRAGSSVDPGGSLSCGFCLLARPTNADHADGGDRCWFPDPYLLDRLYGA